MYFSRDIEKYLLKWKNREHRSVLEVRGARQVGKTTTLLHFGENNYKNVVHIDLTSIIGRTFIEQLKEFNTSVLEVLIQFTEKCSLEFTNDKNTLLLIDEIQESERVYNLIRPFNRQLNCDVIVTGSYLGKTKNYFQPVGDVEYLTLDTLSFSEFIGCYHARATYENMELDNLIKPEWFGQAYKIYSTIGGYPAVVTAYLNNTDYREAMKLVFNTILAELKTRSGSIVQYERVPQMLRTIIDIAMREKKGMKSLNETLTKVFNKYNNFSISKEETYNCIAWLHECGLIDYCNKINLANNTEVDNARFYIKDLGLLNFIADKYGVNDSELAGVRSETFVYRSLIRNNYEDKFYGDRPSFGVLHDYEFDFIVKSRYDMQTYVIEVKSGKGINNNLRIALESGKVDYAVNYKGNTQGGKSEKMITMPIWMAERFEYKLGDSVEKENLERLSIFEEER